MELLAMSVRQTMVVLLVAAAAVGGCSQHVAYSPPQDHNGLEAAEFGHYVTQQPMVTYDEVCRATLLVAAGEEPAGTFVERVTELKSRGIVRQEWDYPAGHVVDRGTLAYMIYKVCDLPGGLNLLLANWTGIGCERYALKEVIREKMTPYGLAYQLPTGGEVMQALSAADDYMVKHGMYETAEREISSPKDVE